MWTFLPEEPIGWHSFNKPENQHDRGKAHNSDSQRFGHVSFVD